jgi:hypothetical protein
MRYLWHRVGLSCRYGRSKRPIASEKVPVGNEKTKLSRSVRIFKNVRLGKRFNSENTANKSGR